MKEIPIAAAVMIALIATPASPADTTVAVSVSSSGAMGNGDSNDPAVSADGRFVAFRSAANNLVAEDSNGTTDVFIHDRQTGMTAMVSRNTGGAQANGESGHSAISHDGRYVAFRSLADNLVPDDTNGRTDIFIHDRQTATTSRISRSSSGTQGNGDSYDPALSGDGRYVVFVSSADNLVKGDLNGRPDIFIHDLRTGATRLISRSTAGRAAKGESRSPAISADGKYVAFESSADNLVKGDLNGRSDIFIHDLRTGATKLVSRSTAGRPGNRDSSSPSLSSDGRYVAFESAADTLVKKDVNGTADIFVHDRVTGTTRLISTSSDGKPANGPSTLPAISGNARYVAFESTADNLTAGDTNGKADGFIHDLKTGQTFLFSRNSDGIQANIGGCIVPAISHDGRYIAFESESGNLVPGDYNSMTDIFVHEGR